MPPTTPPPSHSRHCMVPGLFNVRLLLFSDWDEKRRDSYFMTETDVACLCKKALYDTVLFAGKALIESEQDHFVLETATKKNLVEAESTRCRRCK